MAVSVSLLGEFMGNVGLWLKAAFSVLAFVSLGSVAFAKAPAGTPSTRTMTCDAAVAYVAARGEADLLDGQFLGMDNWVRVRSLSGRSTRCGLREEFRRVYVTTIDSNSCLVGFYCEYIPEEPSTGG